MGQVLLREEQFQIADRAWLMMAFIGIVLSDQPLIRRNKKYRRLADQARGALFELYCLLDPSDNSMPDTRSAEASARYREHMDDDFGKQLLRLKGSVSPEVALEIETPRRRSKQRRRKLGSQSSAVPKRMRKDASRPDPKKRV